MLFWCLLVSCFAVQASKKAVGWGFICVFFVVVCFFKEWGRWRQDKYKSTNGFDLFFPAKAFLSALQYAFVVYCLHRKRQNSLLRATESWLRTVKKKPRNNVIHLLSIKADPLSLNRERVKSFFKVAVSLDTRTFFTMLLKQKVCSGFGLILCAYNVTGISSWKVGRNVRWFSCIGIISEQCY